MKKDKKVVVIIGAGISGLTTAYLLHKKNYQVVVLEKNEIVGGSIETISENGYLFDRGPNSALETTPVIGFLIKELNLEEELLYANKKANKRYILRNNILHALPMSPPAFLKTRLFSLKAKLRLFAEPFIGRSEDGYYQSIAEFVQRRLGKEFLDYAINPFVAGVYAGKPEELSVKSAFPKLYALEEKYGGLIIGTIRSIRERRKRAEVAKQSAKMLSFKEGMQTLPNAIADALGQRVITSAMVNEIKKEETGYKVIFDLKGSLKSIECDAVISTVPAFSANKLFADFDKEISRHFNEIYYPPVLVYYLVYDKESIKRPLDGFGFLIPSLEKKSFLGAIWSSVIFPGRVDDDKAAFTIFIGGSRNPEFVDENREELLERVRKEFEELMKIQSPPIHTSERFWEKAIPQYNLGYVEHERFFDEFEQKNLGLFLSGNYRGGISVGDCIKNSELVTDKVLQTIR
jgi:protoporphyrinogen/coproporphyrinogen III oxidase